MLCGSIACAPPCSWAGFVSGSAWCAVAPLSAGRVISRVPHCGKLQRRCVQVAADSCRFDIRAITGIADNSQATWHPRNLARLAQTCPSCAAVWVCRCGAQVPVRCICSTIRHLVYPTNLQCDVVLARHSRLRHAARAPIMRLLQCVTHA